MPELMLRTEPSLPNYNSKFSVQGRKQQWPLDEHWLGTALLRSSRCSRLPRTPGADLEVEDLGVGVDASGFHEPLVDGCRDVSAGGVDPAGEFSGVEAPGLGGAAGAFFAVVGALDDVAADAGRVGAAAGGVQVTSFCQADSEGQAQAAAGGHKAARCKRWSRGGRLAGFDDDTEMGVAG
ncbi:hypothetical protein [Streptomyces sp. NPDC053069]|uniref:hypothetical protein n=1 Tax=Streptomyces sp. NPDC053069 TaxID=3365695 RepID=UPI0037D9899D